MKRIPFNLNSYVWVSLTEHGRRVLIEEWNDVAAQMNQPVESVLDHCIPGWREKKTRIQAHEMIANFGKCFPMQCHGQTTIPFDATIEIEVEEPEGTK